MCFAIWLTMIAFSAITLYAVVKHKPVYLNAIGLINVLILVWELLLIFGSSRARQTPIVRPEIDYVVKRMSPLVASETNLQPSCRPLEFGVPITHSEWMYDVLASAEANPSSINTCTQSNEHQNVHFYAICCCPSNECNSPLSTHPHTHTPVLFALLLCSSWCSCSCLSACFPHSTDNETTSGEYIGSRN